MQQLYKGHLVLAAYACLALATASSATESSRSLLQETVSLSQGSKCSLSAAEDAYVLAFGGSGDLEGRRLLLSFTRGNLTRLPAQAGAISGYERPLCCPQGSFVTAWQITFLDYKVEAPFNDGNPRYANGTMIGTSAAGAEQVFNARTLAFLSNASHIGSIQGNCTNRDGQLVAVLPRITRSDNVSCFTSPALSRKESSAVTIVNSTLEDKTSDSFYYIRAINSSKLYGNFELSKSNSIYSSSSDAYLPIFYKGMFGVTTEIASLQDKGPFDVANLDPGLLNTSRSDRISGLSNVMPGRADDFSAIAGYSAQNGCFGIDNLHIFTRLNNLSVDANLSSAQPPDSAVYDFSKYQDPNHTYTLNRGRSSDIDDTTVFNQSGYCGKGQYISDFNLTFSGDTSYGDRTPYIWALQGICSDGKVLPVASASACTSKKNQIPKTYGIATIPYSLSATRQTYALYVNAGFKRSGGTYIMQSLLDVGSNGTIPSTTDSQVVASVRGVDRRSQEVDRIVGYSVNATCSGIFSFRFTMMTQAEISSSL